MLGSEVDFHRRPRRIPPRRGNFDLAVDFAKALRIFRCDPLQFLTSNVSCGTIAYYPKPRGGRVPDPGEITQLLTAARTGDRRAESELIAIVYGELRSLARRYMSRERPDHTLQPTALVHETW